MFLLLKKNRINKFLELIFFSAFYSFFKIWVKLTGLKMKFLMNIYKIFQNNKMQRISYKKNSTTIFGVSEVNRHYCNNNNNKHRYCCGFFIISSEAILQANW